MNSRIPVDAKGMNEAVVSRKPGDKVKLTVARTGNDREVEVILGHKMERSFRIQPVGNPSHLQAAILRDWLNGPR